MTRLAVAALCAAAVICSAGVAHADWYSALHDCLSDHNKALHLRHRECFAQELAKLPQQTRAEHGEIIRIMTGTAAIEDKNDAKDDADERAGVHREIKDERVRRQLQAIDEISDCRANKYKNHHSDCGRRVMAQTPPEDRTEAFVKWTEMLATADQNDKDIGHIFATFDRLGRSERFDRELKAATPGTGETLPIVARYCTGRGEPRIGMTWLEVEQDTTWCIPSAINETITAGRTRQQAVFYGDRPGSGGNTGYLYFEDGKLVAIQRRN
jgi:hypothetical protein